MPFSLKQTKQCKTCPWIVGNDPFDIKNYDPALHKGLECTISRDATLHPTNAMACHCSKEGEEFECLGWLMNQLGPGNNIALRIKFLHCDNIKDVELIGEQHKRFEDTLPDEDGDDWIHSEEDYIDD